MRKIKLERGSWVTSELLEDGLVYEITSTTLPISGKGMVGVARVDCADQVEIAVEVQKLVPFWLQKHDELFGSAFEVEIIDLSRSSRIGAVDRAVYKNSRGLRTHVPILAISALDFLGCGKQK